MKRNPRWGEPARPLYGRWMRWCLVLIAVISLIIAPTPAGNDFQDVGDLTGWHCIWNHNTGAGNSVLDILASLGCEESGSFTGIVAFTVSGPVDVRFTNSSGHSVWVATAGAAGETHRYEYAVVNTAGDLHIQRTNEIGGVARSNALQSVETPTFYEIYCPSSVCGDIDDFSSSSDVTMGGPEYGEYSIVEDTIHTAYSGIVRNSDNAVVGSDLTATWAKPYDATGNDTITLENLNTGIVYLTEYSGTASDFGTVTFHTTDFFATDAPFGWYVVKMLGSTSNPIYYRPGGAVINYDAEAYIPGDTAILTYGIGEDYWDTSNQYRIDVISGTDGQTIYTTPLVTSNGTISFEFETSDAQGVYYAAIVQTDGGTSNWIGMDYADLDTYVVLYGYVNDNTGTPIVGANVTIVQGDLSSTAITISDGNYTSGNFYANYATTINATATGYLQYVATIIPLSPSRISINITLPLLTGGAMGSTIGGVARDGVLTTGVNISRGYGRPIAGATVFVKNTSTSEQYNRTANIAGWYACGETESCFLTTGRLYDVWGTASGYNNSPNYTAVAP